jgi:hypothetical protein
MYRRERAFLNPSLTPSESITRSQVVDFGIGRTGLEDSFTQIVKFWIEVRGRLTGDDPRGLESIVALLRALIARPPAEGFDLDVKGARIAAAKLKVLVARMHDLEREMAKASALRRQVRDLESELARRKVAAKWGVIPARSIPVPIRRRRPGR